VRRVIYAINVTLDGRCDHTLVPPPGEGVMEYFIDLVRGAGLFAYGRKTYELMVPYWPDIAKDPTGADESDAEFAKAFVAVGGTVVFSRTLKEAGSLNTRVVRTDPGDEILRLKQEPGKYILLGGVDVAAQLIQRDLVDEYRLVVAPMVAGHGRWLWEGVGFDKSRSLTLVESITFKSGVVALHYVKQ
jgi:dihydrofolate reductase